MRHSDIFGKKRKTVFYKSREIANLFRGSCDKVVYDPRVKKYWIQHLNKTGLEY